MSTPVNNVHASVIAKRIRTKPPVVVPIGFGLNDEREECFCLLIADGVPLAIAFKTAGFAAKAKARSALDLYKAQRIQARVTAILQARASHPAISLSEVTDMLKRVYVGAIHDTEYNAAHNAAFSLARLHGLVVDRAQLDVIRRPSREPDAPSEIALSDWIQQLPGTASTTQVVSRADATQIVGPGPYNPSLTIEGSAFGCDLDAPTRGAGIENGAPTTPVTGTPHSRAHSSSEAADPSPGAPSGYQAHPHHEENGSPFSDQGTPIPKMEDLF